jgi:hypothetical protein
MDQVRSRAVLLMRKDGYFSRAHHPSHFQPFELGESTFTAWVLSGVRSGMAALIKPMTAHTYRFCRRSTIARAKQ